MRPQIRAIALVVGLLAALGAPALGAQGNVHVPALSPASLVANQPDPMQVLLDDALRRGPGHIGVPANVLAAAVSQHVRGLSEGTAASELRTASRLLGRRVSPAPGAAGASGTTTKMCGTGPAEDATWTSTLAVVRECVTFSSTGQFSTMAASVDLLRWSDGHTLWHHPSAKGTHDIEIVFEFPGPNPHRPLFIDWYLDGWSREGYQGPPHTTGLIGIDAHTGKTLWQQTFKAQTASTPVSFSSYGAGDLVGFVKRGRQYDPLVAVRGRVRYVAGGFLLDDNTLHVEAIDGLSGRGRAVLPQIDTKTVSFGVWPVSSLDAKPDDDVVLTEPSSHVVDEVSGAINGSTTGVLVGLDAATGKTLWTSKPMPMTGPRRVTNSLLPRSPVYYLDVERTGLLPVSPPVQLPVGPDTLAAKSQYWAFKLTGTTGAIRWQKADAVYAEDLGTGLSGVQLSGDDLTPHVDQYIAMRDDGSTAWATPSVPVGPATSTGVFGLAIGDLQPDHVQDVLYEIYTGATTTDSVYDGRTGTLLRRNLTGRPYWFWLVFSLDKHGDDLLHITEPPVTATGVPLPGTTTVAPADGRNDKEFWSHSTSSAVSDLWIVNTEAHVNATPVLAMADSVQGHLSFTFYDARNGHVLRRWKI